MAEKLEISEAESLLDLPEYYGLQDVHLAYRIRCKEMHPDARQGVSLDVANAEMSRITSSYSLLRKQFRGEAKDAKRHRSGMSQYSRTESMSQSRAATIEQQMSGSADGGFDPFGDYSDYVDVDEWFTDVASNDGRAFYSDGEGAFDYSPTAERYGEYVQQMHKWNSDLQEAAAYHQSHIDPHSIDRSRQAHTHDESPFRQKHPMLVSSCDGPGWWRDLAWFIDEDPSWYRDAMRLAHWLPWTLIVYIVAIVAYPLPILNQYGEMLLRGDIGSPIWYYSLFLMVYPFVGWLARHFIHDLLERVFAFPFRIVYRIIMKVQRGRQQRGYR